MSRIKTRTEVKVYEKDAGDWGRSEDKIELETYWNDDQGEYVVLNIDGHAYTVVARDLTAAIRAVTTR